MKFKRAFKLMYNGEKLNFQVGVDIGIGMMKRKQ